MSFNQSSSEDFEAKLTSAQLLEVCQKYDKMTATVESSKGQIGTEKLLKYQNKCSKFNKVFVIDDESSVTIHYLKLSLFTHLKELYLHMCPPSVFVDLYSLRGQLEVIEFTNSGITDLLRVFQPPLVAVKGTSNGQNTGTSSSSKTISSSAGTALTPSYLNQRHVVSSSGSIVGPMDSTGGPDPRYEELFSTLTPMVLDAAPVDTWLRENYNWKNVQKLLLCNCGIARLDEAMHFFPRVESLNLSHNDISQVIHLQDCAFLFSLDLSFNRIRVLSNISLVLGNVKQLCLSNNQIQSLDGLSNLYSLIELDVSGNCIEDFAEIQHIRRLPCLENVWLRGNPMARYMTQSQYRSAVFHQLILGKDMGRDLQQSTRSVPELDGVPMSKEETLAFSAHLYKAPIDQQFDLLRGDDSVYIFPFADSDIVDIYADDNDVGYTDDDRNDDEPASSTGGGAGGVAEGSSQDDANRKSMTKSRNRRSRKKGAGSGSQSDLSPLMNEEQAYTAAALMDQFTGKTNTKNGKTNGKVGNNTKSLMRRQAEQSAGRRSSHTGSSVLLDETSTPRGSVRTISRVGVPLSPTSTITDVDAPSRSSGRAKIIHRPTYFTANSTDAVPGAVGRCDCGELIFPFSCSKNGSGKPSRHFSTAASSEIMIQQQQQQLQLQTDSLQSASSTNEVNMSSSVNSSTQSNPSESPMDMRLVRQTMVHMSDSIDFIAPSESKAAVLSDSELQSYLTSVLLLPPHVQTAEDYLREYGRPEPVVRTQDPPTDDYGFSLLDMTPGAAGKSRVADTPEHDSFFASPPSRDADADTPTDSHSASGRKAKSTLGDSQDDTKLPKKNLRAMMSRSSGLSQSERTVGQSSIPGQESPTSLLESFKKEKQKKSGNSLIRDQQATPRSASDGSSASTTTAVTSTLTPGSAGWRSFAANSVERVYLSDVAEESDAGDDSDVFGDEITGDADLSMSQDLLQNEFSDGSDGYAENEYNDNDGGEIPTESGGNDTLEELHQSVASVDHTNVSSSEANLSNSASTLSVLPRPRAKTGPRSASSSSSNHAVISTKESGDSNNIQSLLQLLSVGTEVVKSSSIRGVLTGSKKGSEKSTQEGSSGKDLNNPPPPTAVRPRTPPGGGPRVSGSVFGDTYSGPSTPTVPSRSRTVSDASRSRYSIGKRPSVPRNLEYIGKKQFQGLNVMENFSLYFAEQVFSPLRADNEPPYVLRPGLESKVAKVMERARQSTQSPTTSGKSPAPTIPSTYFVSPPPREEHFFAAFTVSALDLSYDLLQLLKIQDEAKLDVQYEVNGTFAEENPTMGRYSSTSQPSSVPSSLASSKNPSPTNPSPLSRLKNISSRLVSGKANSDEGKVPGGLTSGGTITDMPSITEPEQNPENGKNTKAQSVVITDPRIRKHSVSAQQGLEEPVEESSFIFALTDASLYIFRKQCFPADSLFRHAPVPVLYRCHPMHQLQ